MFLLLLALAVPTSSLRTRTNQVQLELEKTHLSQDELKIIYQVAKEVDFVPYVKQQIIGLIRLPDEAAVDAIPPAVVERLGALDQSKYGDDVINWMKRRDENGKLGAVVIQFKGNGEPEFYPIKPADLALYEQQDEELWMQSPVFSQMKAWAKSISLELVGSLFEMVEGNLKTVPQPFVTASKLGFPIERQLVITPPWGANDVQIKPSGKECWFTMNPEKGIYMVNDGGLGCPSNYRRAGNAWPGRVPKPL